MENHSTRLAINVISADSHIVEPPNCYPDYISPKFRDRAPHVMRDPNSNHGDVYVLPGIEGVLPIGLVAAAGIDPKELRQHGRAFSDMHPGGWDPVARLADQDRDGVSAEMIYPSIGMALCGHPDTDLKHESMWAYNRWLQEFTAAAPTRLFGLGQTAIRSVPETVRDFERFKEMGFKGVMMPCEPATEFDYDDPRFDPLWQASTDLNLPISFHVLTSSRDKNIFGGASRGPQIASWSGVIRTCQDIIGMFIYGKVFERNPGLRLVCVEADAGWAPHFKYRMDHVYKRHRAWLKCDEMQKLPSEYFDEHVYLTFQDDWTAFNMVDMCNPRRLMWANDFPHSDSTWPWSQEILIKHTAGLSEQEKLWILRENVKELYQLENVA